MHAETAYLFRHALLRDAAYQMQLPGDRAKLHELAFYLIEGAFGGRAPIPSFEPAPDDRHHHETDAVCAELAEHARLAVGDGAGRELAEPRRLYVNRAALWALRQHQRHTSVRYWDELAEITKGAERAWALYYAASLDVKLGNVERSHERLAAAVGFGDHSGDALLRGRLLLMQSEFAQLSGDIRSAVAFAERALKVHRGAGNRAQEATALAALATHRWQARMPEGVLDQLEEALAIHREIGDAHGEARTINQLGRILAVSGRLEEAEDTFRRALALSRDLKDRASEGHLLGNIANVYKMTNRFEQAEATYSDALAIHREVNDRWREGQELANLSDLYLRLNRLSDCRRICERALEIHREVGSLLDGGSIHCRYGLLLIADGDLEAARASWLEGFAVARRGPPQVQARRIEEMRDACAKAGVAPFEVPGS